MVDDDVDLVVFHRGIKVFLDGGLQAVDFVDEKNGPRRQGGEQAGQVARFFNGRTAGALHFGAHGVAQNESKGGFAQPRRAGEQNVLERVTACLGRIDHQLEPFDNAGLPGEFGKHRRPQGHIERCLGGLGRLAQKVFARHSHAE